MTAVLPRTSTPFEERAVADAGGGEQNFIAAGEVCASGNVVSSRSPQPASMSDFVLPRRAARSWPACRRPGNAVPPPPARLPARRRCPRTDRSSNRQAPAQAAAAMSPSAIMRSDAPMRRTSSMYGWLRGRSSIITTTSRMFLPRIRAVISITSSSGASTLIGKLRIGDPCLAHCRRIRELLQVERGNVLQRRLVAVLRHGGGDATDRVRHPLADVRRAVDGSRAISNRGEPSPRCRGVRP